MIKSVAKNCLYFVISFYCCASAATIRRDCTDCVVFNFCDAAVTLLRKRDPAADAQLKSAFCGFSYNKLPMVCCSELTVVNHPNLYLLPDKCGKNKKIAGGRPARRYEFPWMVLLAYETPLGPQFKCGGSLINERHVLTAAHCIADDLLGVRVGELDVDATTACEEDHCRDIIQDFRIQEAIRHPKYSGRPKVRNDIGLLTLSDPVKLLSKNTGVICLPVTREQWSRNLSKEVATIAGWGYTEQGYGSSILRTVAVPIYNADYCRQLYNRGRKPGEEDETTNKLCAGQKGMGSCDGDSGGPLMVKQGDQFIQYGVDSYGPTLCGADFPSAYTDVREYMKWILDTLTP